MLPASVAARSKGGTVRWELQTSPQLNQANFFVFYVYDVGAASSSSPTIGYFAVNKHTAEVWDMGVAGYVKNPDLLGVQQILRKGHCIADMEIKRYTSERPDSLSK